MNAAVHNVPDGPVEPKRLLDEEVDDLLADLNSLSNVTLAVSGGADSLCLLVLFSEWKERSGWQGRADVVVVDHGLRPESGDEARYVVQCAKDRGLDCTILKWTGEKPERNIQEEARLARYQLISDHIKSHGAEALLLGHHLDDQVETFLDRLTRGSGIYGLSAMAVDEPNGPMGLRLLRPFLGTAKGRLEASLGARGLSWCKDPSNTDTKYKRSRLRRMAQLLAEEGLSADRIAQTARQMRHAREALEVSVQQIFDRDVVEHPAGPLKILRKAYRASPLELRLRLLTLMIARATGNRARVRLRQLQVLDEALIGSEASRNTLSGALFMADDSTVFCWREPGRTLPEILVGPKDGELWDQRFFYSVEKKSTSKKVEADIVLGPLCKAPILSADILWPDGWPKEVFDCSPVVWSRTAGVLKLPDSLEFRDKLALENPQLVLERVPFQGKLLANYRGDEAESGEI